MPSAASYDPQNESLRRAADQERQSRAAASGRAWAYYEGRHAQPLKVRPGGPDNNVVVNLVALHVDHTIAFAVPDFPVIELDEERDTEAEKTIRALWRSAGGATWLSSLMQFGMLNGHVFVRLLPGAPGSFPRIVALNPANVLCFWAADDLTRPLWYEVYYSASGTSGLVQTPNRRQDILAPGAAENTGWQIREYVSTGGAGWQLQQSIDWPYAAPPIIEWQHLPKPGAFYGAHEVGNLALNDAVNKVASDVKAILRTHASPRVVGFGFQADKLQETAVDALWTIPDANARVQLLEMNGDLASSMAFMEYLSRTYLELARVTVLTGGPEAYKGITNLGVRSAFMAQVAKTRTLHATYGAGLARITQAALALMGLSIALPALKWQTALPESGLESVQTLVQERAMGIVSQETAAQERGYNWSLEKARMAAEGETPRVVVNQQSAPGAVNPSSEGGPIV